MKSAGVRVSARWARLPSDSVDARAGESSARGCFECDWRVGPTTQWPTGLGCAGEESLGGPNGLAAGPSRVLIFFHFISYFLSSLSQFKHQFEFEFEFRGKLVFKLNIPLEYDMI
jgi:hypothetical protein